MLCISLLTCNNALAARHTSISTSRACSCPLYRRAEDRIGTLSIMLLYQASRRADRIGKICKALTNGPQGNDAPDHQPFTTLLLQLGGKSEIFALWWGPVKLCLLQSEVFASQILVPALDWRKTRQHINMGLSLRAATKPAAFSCQDDQLISDPCCRATSTQLHMLKCLLRSAVALIYTPSHSRGICPPHPHFTFCRPLNSSLLLFIPRQPSSTTRPAVTSHIGSC